MESCLFLVCRVPHPNVGASMEMGVDVSKFSEVDIKMDGVFGSGIVHFICKFNLSKNNKKQILLRDHIFLVGHIYYDTWA